MRCTRKDGSIGLVSVCGPCHTAAAERLVKPRSYSEKHRRAVARNKRLDKAAKLARGACECDDRCGRRVRARHVGMFEWDHFVQSFDDPRYQKVGHLASSNSSAARCDEERAKCRLLYISCHRRHSAEQTRQRRAQRRARL